jgi:potassium-transporting ATPase KdpC subunit
MLQALGIALRASAVTLVVTGLAYPLIVTGVAQIIFPDKANGQLVSDSRGVVVGSSLIAQPFSQPGYLAPRPSAAGDKGFDPMSSGGSNLGPTSAKLQDRVKADLARLSAENPDAPGPVPIELVTASASGLDPEISPEAALWQASRIAKARGVALDRVRAALLEGVEGPDLFVLGEPRLNVLLTNLVLDRRFGAPHAPTAQREERP